MEGDRECCVLLENTDENRISINNLDPNITVNHLKSAFGRFGKIVKIELLRGDDLTKSCATVTFFSKKSAIEAIVEMNQNVLGQAPIFVSHARRTEDLQTERSLCGGSNETERCLQVYEAENDVKAEKHDSQDSRHDGTESSIDGDSEFEPWSSGGTDSDDFEGIQYDHREAMGVRNSIQSAQVTKTGHSVDAHGDEEFLSLYIHNLHPDVTVKMLFEKFSAIGPLATVHMLDRSSEGSSCYARVNFHSSRDGEKAINALQLSTIMGRPMKIYADKQTMLRECNIGNVFIKNLEKSIDKHDLEMMFSQFGTIISCKVACDTNGPKGYGFVQFESDEAAAVCIDTMNGACIKGQKLYLEKFKNKRERTESSPSSDETFTNVYIKNFGEHLDEAKLRELFGPFGDIASTKVMVDATGKSKGFGFVSFTDHNAAAKAAYKLNGRKVSGRTIYVGRAKKKEERDAEIKVKQHRLAGTNIYIKNLSPEIDDGNLLKLFAEFGTITSAKVMTEAKGSGQLKGPPKSKGFGFVCYKTPEEAKKAITVMNGRVVKGKPLYVSLAQKKEDRKVGLELQRETAKAYSSTQGAIPLVVPTSSHKFTALRQPLLDITRQVQVIPVPIMPTSGGIRFGWPTETVYSGGQKVSSLCSTSVTQLTTNRNDLVTPSIPSPYTEAFVGPSKPNTCDKPSGMDQSEPRGAHKSQGNTSKTSPTSTNPNVLSCSTQSENLDKGVSELQPLDTQRQTTDESSPGQYQRAPSPIDETSANSVLPTSPGSVILDGKYNTVMPQGTGESTSGYDQSHGAVPLHRHRNSSRIAANFGQAQLEKASDLQQYKQHDCNTQLRPQTPPTNLSTVPLGHSPEPAPSNTSSVHDQYGNKHTEPIKEGSEMKIQSEVVSPVQIPAPQAEGSVPSVKEIEVCKARPPSGTASMKPPPGFTGQVLASASLPMTLPAAPLQNPVSTVTPFPVAQTGLQHSHLWGQFNLMPVPAPVDPGYYARGPVMTNVSPALLENYLATKVQARNQVYGAELYKRLQQRYPFFVDTMVATLLQLDDSQLWPLLVSDHVLMLRTQGMYRDLVLKMGQTAAKEDIILRKNVDGGAPDNRNLQHTELKKAVSSLKSADEKTQFFGERLLPFVHLRCPELAGKITGMLLGLQDDELIDLLLSPDALSEKVEQARQSLLLEYAKSVHPGTLQQTPESLLAKEPNDILCGINSGDTHECKAAEQHEETDVLSSDHAKPTNPRNVLQNFAALAEYYSSTVRSEDT